MTLAYAGIDFEIREVELRNKPASLLALSPKGTVPVMCIDSVVLEESLDIVHWALDQHDPEGWRDFDWRVMNEMAELVEACEREFKPRLDSYKYSDRHSSVDQQEHRRAAEVFIAVLERQLSEQPDTADRFLSGNRPSWADVAVFPFVRQFAHVDRSWFDASPYCRSRLWLDTFLQSDLFLSIMKKYTPWQEGDPGVVFAISR
jgi:glutathione S-transferase